MGNLIVTDYLMQAHGIVNLKMPGPTPFGNHTQAMATRKEWAALISLIDRGLASIPAEQHIAIRQHWLASVADAEQQAPLDLDDEERAWLADHPTIRVGAYPLAPYIREQSGQVDGYLVELLEAVAARAGLRTEFRFQSLGQVLAGIRQGRLDVTMAVSPTAERSRALFLSKGTTAFTLNIFARKEARDITGVESLAGKTLATYRGYSWNARYPELLPQTRVLVADDMEAMFRMVADGRADAAISETEAGKVLLRRHLLTGVEPKAIAIFGGRRSLTGHYWGVGGRLPLLASILDKAHAALPEAEKQRIWNRWFAQETGAGQVDLNAEDRAYLAATLFRRAIATAWTPFDFADAHGAPAGVAEDYWRLIRDKLGLRETTTERRPFGEILAALQQGETDIYAATTRTADRERYALFSDPYERYPIAIAGAAGAGLFAGTASLDGRRVAVGRDYSAYHLLKARSPGIDFVVVDDTRAALEAVVAGRAEAAVDILPVLHQQIEGFPPGRVKLVGVTDVQFPLEPEALYAELCRKLRLSAAGTRARRPASAAVAQKTALPGFDAARVRRWLTESPDAWRSMVRTFVAGYPEAVAAIRTALDTGEGVELLRQIEALDFPAALETLRRLEPVDKPGGERLERADGDHERKYGFEEARVPCRRAMRGLRL